MKKILITSGGTREYIDDVRVLTNISSGKLGARIAETFCNANYTHYEIDRIIINKDQIVHTKIEEQPYEVYYLHTKVAVKPIGATIASGYCPSFMGRPTTVNDETIKMIEVNSVQEVYDKMEELVPQMDVVIHCMAVSDFTFNRDNPVKLKSNDADGFIDYMRDNIVKAPKIITKIKEWNPNVFLVGFKFEVGLSEKELISLACDSMKVYDGDLVVANDKAQMVREGKHVAYICRGKTSYERQNSKECIANAILRGVQEDGKDKVL